MENELLNSTVFYGIEGNSNLNKQQHQEQQQQQKSEGLDKFILDFDMFDINTGKTISCDHSPPKYEPSLRWDSGINYKMEIQQHEIHKSINNIENLIEESEKIQYSNQLIQQKKKYDLIQQNSYLLQEQKLQLQKLQHEQDKLQNLRLKQQQLAQQHQLLIEQQHQQQQEKEKEREREQKEREETEKLLQHQQYQQHQQQQQQKQQQEEEEKRIKEFQLKNKLEREKQVEKEKEILKLKLEKERLEKENEQILVECTHMNPASKVSQFQHYVNEKFEVSAVKFYSLMIDSDFWAFVSREVGFLEMNEGGWKTSESKCHQERVLSFKTPISFKIGPKVASVTQTQKIKRTSTNGYMMETSSQSKDVPYGESFSVENYLSLEPCPDAPEDSCVLKVSTAVKFNKTIWGLSGLIEKTVTQSNKDFFSVWINFAKKRIVDQPSVPETLTSCVTLINHSTHELNSIIQSQPQQSQPINNVGILNNSNNNNQNQNQNYNSNNNSIINNLNNNLSSSPLPKSIINNIGGVSSNSNSNNNNNNNNLNYDEIKNIFYKLFKEMNEEKEETKVVKIFSAKKNQHLCNITVTSKQTISYLVQFLIPQMFPQLNRGQHFELYWIDKKNEYCQFFYKDLDQPIFSFICNVDAFGIQTIQDSQISNKLLSFVIVNQGQTANIKYNSSLCVDNSF